MASPGLDSGNTILKNVFIFPQPSISALSSNSRGISFIKFVRINIDIGRLKATYGPTKAHIVLYNPIFWVNKNIGINVTCTGIVIAITTKPNKVLFILNFSLAKT